MIIYLWLWAGASMAAIVAGCIGAHSNHCIATEPYRMDLDAAQHRHWQSMHPARHRATVIGARSNLAYVPRHAAAAGATTQEFNRIVEALHWEKAAA